MNTLIKPTLPAEVPTPDENIKNDGHLRALPGATESVLKLFSDESNKDTKNWFRKNKNRALKVEMNTENQKRTVYLSGEINIDSVKNRMEEHMEAYPEETAAGFYARFIDYTQENTWYLVLPCGKNEKNSVIINWLPYKLYPFWDHSKNFVNLFANELSEILVWDMSEENAVESIYEKMIKILELSPLDEKWIIKFKNKLIDILLKDPKILNKFWKNKYVIFDWINNAFEKSINK